MVQYTRITITTDIPHVIGAAERFSKSLKTPVAKELGNVWSMWVVKAAKRRAIFSADSTGTLKKGIGRKEDGPKTWEVGYFGKSRRYGRYVERGFRPHWIPVEYINIHRQNPGQKGHPLSKEEIMETGGYVYVDDNNIPTGLITKSLAASRKKIPDFLKKAMTKATGMKNV